VQFNSTDGIEVSYNCVVSANDCYNNGTGAAGGAGIFASSGNNRIEGNSCSQNDRGIDVNGAGNLIIRNSATDNSGTGSPSADFDIAPGNFLGTIVTTEGAMNTSTNSNANIAF
jgi:parallel beta-helix repeat protein